MLLSLAAAANRQGFIILYGQVVMR